MDFRVLSLGDEEWSKALGYFPVLNKDINYYPEWFYTWKEHEQADAICIFAEIDDIYFMYPFFVRRIENFDLGKQYYDVQSAYGYGGIITSNLVIPQQTGKKFNQLVTDWMVEKSVIAEFIREHPLLNYFRREAEYTLARTNVYIETERTYKIPDKRARQNINKSLKLNATIIYDEDLKYMDEFVTLYNSTAKRLNMHSYYHFGKSYFSKVMEHLYDYSALIHVKYNDIFIASGLLIRHHEKGNLHLAGSLMEFQEVRANDLLYYGAINYSIENGVKVLNVGGGTGTNADDTLFRFKSKYSNNHKAVFIGKKIINHEVYKRLVLKWEDRYPQLTVKYRNYFLKYHQEA